MQHRSEGLLAKRGGSPPCYRRHHCMLGSVRQGACYGRWTMSTWSVWRRGWRPSGGCWPMRPGGGRSRLRPRASRGRSTRGPGSARARGGARRCGASQPGTPSSSVVTPSWMGCGPHCVEGAGLCPELRRANRPCRAVEDRPTLSVTERAGGAVLGRFTDGLVHLIPRSTRLLGEAVGLAMVRCPMVHPTRLGMDPNGPGKLSVSPRFQDRRCSLGTDDYRSRPLALKRQSEAQ